MNWTFKLRKDVKFHDGEPFNAKTIEWWMPKFKGTENAFMTDAIDKVVIVDDYTVEVHDEESRSESVAQHGHAASWAFRRQSRTMPWATSSVSPERSAAGLSSSKLHDRSADQAGAQ